MKSPYLQDSYAPVSDEAHRVRLSVQGEVPLGLRGRYLRNGPNPAFEPKGHYHIWDGDGMLHAISFEDDGVFYSNRWVETAALQAERRAGRALYGGLLDSEPPPEALVGPGNARKNPANTAIVRHADKLMALWESGRPTLVAHDLETLGTDNFAGALEGPMTAHPKIDPVSGEMLFFGYSPIPPYLRYHVVDAAGKLVRSIAIDLPNPVMMHDFAITQDYAVFLDAPAVFDFDSHARGGSIISWKPELGTRIGVMPRRGDADDLRWIDIETSYVFHFLNAWNEGPRIHLTGARCPWIALDLENDVPPEGLDANAYLTEFTIDLDADSCRHARIGELPGEFCKIPDAMTSLENRYGYLATFSTGIEEDALFDSLTQYDLETGRQTLKTFGNNKVVGEPAFAPDLAGDGAEDAGWVVTYVHDRDGSASEFVVLDARAFDAEPVARIRMPRRVPVGFHGNWLTP